MKKEVVLCGLIALCMLISTTSVSSYVVKNIEAAQNTSSSGLGDLQFMFGLEAQTGDFQTVGCEYDGTYFYITGGNNGTDPNKVYKFDSDGNYVSSFDQTGTTDWGWIDLAWDGQYLYGGRDGGIIDVFTTDGTVINQITAPVPWPVGMAYDPATNHLWTTDRFSDTNFYEIDMAGNVITIQPNTKLVYGLAWDDVCAGGPYLWCSAFVEGGPECTFHQYNPLVGGYTGVSFEAADPGGTVSNKCCGLGFTTDWNTSAGILFGIQQCDQLPDGPGDLLGGYEICEIGEPVPAICCSGSLSWINVVPGSTVNGEFYVENCGEGGSELDWEVSEWPGDWGTGWTFNPANGTGLTPAMGQITVIVEVTAPTDPETEFTGKVKVINSDDPSEFCEIDVYLKTPRARQISNPVIVRILERFQNAFPILQHLLQRLGLQ
jgi:hypothetical protein